MATSKKPEATTNQSEEFLLEQRKVKALEKIANTLDSLTVWFEEIEKQDWSDRIQHYLYQFDNNIKSIAESADALVGNSSDGGSVGRPKKDSEK